MHYGAKLGYKSAIVRTPVSDIFFISLHHATSVPLTIFLDVGTGKQRKVLNISELSEALGVNYCAALLGLHVFTGEVVTSAFKGKGKIVTLRKLQSYPKYLETFRTLGDAEPFDDNQGWIVKDNVLEPLWAKGPILPSNLIDIMDHVNTEFDEKEEDEEDVDFLELEMTLSDED
ncbi:uncharacterized protein LOC127869202 [Dreissena polymorpha]|uniref:uncharacterized protein LOC127869202 n=1 Tax=Dreissena polymorpha TaxID=45954 RepID=UPI00226527C3|nr:uncharacterized protein LOC127869202 [Dreissena polymorpha]